MFIRAQMFVSHPQRIHSSLNARHLPPPFLFEPECSPSASTISIRAQMLVCHLYRIHSTPNARRPPSPCTFKPECLSSTSTMSIRAFDTRLPPPLSPFKPECSSSTSNMFIRAQTLVSHLQRVYSSLNARCPPPPSIRVQMLVSHI